RHPPPPAAGPPVRHLHRVPCIRATSGPSIVVVPLGTRDKEGFMQHRHRRALVALALITSTSALAVGAGAPANAAAPAAGSERAVTTARAGNSHANAAAAWNGSVYLVVWEEHFA